MHDSHFFHTLDEFGLPLVHPKTALQPKTKNLAFVIRGQSLTNTNCASTTFSAILFFLKLVWDHLLLEKTKKLQICNFKTYITYLIYNLYYLPILQSTVVKILAL